MQYVSYTINIQKNPTTKEIYWKKITLVRGPTASDYAAQKWKDTVEDIIILTKPAGDRLGAIAATALGSKVGQFQSLRGKSFQLFEGKSTTPSVRRSVSYLKCNQS
jgi:hypothetical protein